MNYVPGNTGGAYAAPAAVRLGAALSARRQQASSSATRLSVLRRDISCKRELITDGPDIQYFQIYGRISNSADGLAVSASRPRLPLSSTRRISNR